MSPESRQPSEPWRPRLYLPAYAVKDAARYAGTSPRTVAYWHYGGAGLGPALPGKERRKPLSYLQLIEVAVVATFRDLGVSLQQCAKHATIWLSVSNGNTPLLNLTLRLRATMS